MRIGILGAAQGTGNLGVDALGISAVSGLLRACPDAEISFQSWVLDQPVEIRFNRNAFELQSLVIRRREGSFYGINRLRNVHRWASFAGFGGRCAAEFVNKTYQRLRSLDVVLDVSAGDSFADIYGSDVFDYQTAIKELILDLDIPLVLLPQTYGPFHDADSIERAASVFRRCAFVATREANGADDVHRACSGERVPEVIYSPDMAFILPPEPVSSQREPWLGTASDEVTVGINVSGMLCLSDRSFGLKVDYKTLISRLIDSFLAREKTRVLLVPHVIGLANVNSSGDYSSDVTDTLACKNIMSALSDEQRKRVSCVGGPYSACETKYLISHCDFFVGARMHACIAAISQSIPTSLLAYSKKASGLLRSLDLEELVVDLRDGDTNEVVNSVLSAFDQRQQVRQRLEERIPAVKQEVHDFFEQQLVPRIQGIQSKNLI